MIDIRHLLAGLMRALRSADFPDANTLAAVLDLNISQARITKTKQGNMGINGARLNGSAVEVGITCGITPRREIWLLFDNSSTPYRDVKDEIFGANQRVQPSKRSAGFGVLFEIDGLICGFTVSSSDGDVDSLFCEEPKPASAG
ncbi:MAG: hypothetical protein ACLPID_00970 [Beijerinckiaceae bacterium]